MDITKRQKFEIINLFKEKVVSKKDIILKFYNVIQDKKESIKIFNSFRRINKIKFIFQGYYYILTEEERLNNIIKYSNFELIGLVLNKLNIKWYFALNTANDLNKIIWQPSKNIYIINNKFSKIILLNKQKVIFSKFKKDIIIEYNKHLTKNRIQLNISSIEKTYLDFEYLKKEIPIELKEKVNFTKIKKIRSKLKWK